MIIRRDFMQNTGIS